MKFLLGDVYEILRFAQDDKMEDRMTGWRLGKRLHDSLLLIIPVSSTFASLNLNR